MRKVALILFVVIWFGNYHGLSAIYDVTTYDGYVSFWSARGILYNGMFLALSVMLFKTYTGIEKAIACFMMIITAGGVMDELLFKQAGYMYGDIVLIISGIITSVIIYGRTRKRD